jgi:ParB/RepB/Spo0J family partition protein
MATATVKKRGIRRSGEGEPAGNVWHRLREAHAGTHPAEWATRARALLLEVDSRLGKRELIGFETVEQGERLIAEFLAWKQRYSHSVVDGLIDPDEGSLCGNCGATGEEMAAAADRRATGRKPAGGKAKGGATGGLTAARSPRAQTVGSEAQPTKAGSVLAKTQIVEVPVEKIHRRPSNRGGVPVTFPEVADLMESIQQFGLSSPLELRTTSDEQELPIGHLELVKGERRWMACRALKRETVPAIVRELDRQAAAIAVAVDNTHRRDLDPIQRAKAVRDAIAAGATEDEAGLAAGIPKGSKNALRLLELPEAVQDLVATGRLSQRIALAAVPYVTIAGIMAGLFKAVKAKDWWVRGENNYQHGLEQLVHQHTRPVDAARKYKAGYQAGGDQTCAFAKELVGADRQLTAEAREALHVVEVRLANKPTLLATNVKAWDQRQAKAREESKKVQETQRRKKSAKAKAAGKAANPAAEAQQDRTLEDHTERHALLWLRLLIAERLVPGDARTRRVAAWVRDTAREGYGNVCPAVDWNVSAAHLLGHPSGECRWEEPQIDEWERSGQLYGGDDPQQAGDVSECLRAQLQLFPAWRPWSGLQVPPYDKDCVAGDVLAPPEKIPERYPTLDDDELRQAAEWLASVPGFRVVETVWPTRIKDGWAAARQVGSYHRELLAQWLAGFKTRRQLQGLVSELGLTDQVPASVTLTATRDAILEAHTGPKGLPLPKALAATAAPPKPKAKRAAGGRAAGRKPAGGKAKGQPPAGVCRECGCTEDAACEEGCSWADETRTLCTACAGEED